MSKKVKYFKKAHSGGFKFMESDAKIEFMNEQGWAVYEGENLEGEAAKELISVQPLNKAQNKKERLPEETVQPIAKDEPKPKRSKTTRKTSSKSKDNE